jgi:siroheme decarboxylase
LKLPSLCAKISTVDRFLKKIPHDFPVTERPYKEMAEKAGVSEEELLERLEQLKEEGTIRRVAAILYHRKALYTHNAMVVWKVGESDTERIGRIMASFPEVSHCYERDTGGFWEYTLYTMIHGKDMGSCLDTVKRMSEKTGITEFEIFLSKREFKKTSLSVEDDAGSDG